MTHRQGQEAQGKEREKTKTADYTCSCALGIGPQGAHEGCVDLWLT